MEETCLNTKNRKTIESNTRQSSDLLRRELFVVVFKIRSENKEDLAVSIPKQRHGGTAFKGLAISNSQTTYLDGNGAAHAWWWNSVGNIKKYRDDIPAFNGECKDWIQSN
eukprot:1034333_1